MKCPFCKKDPFCYVDVGVGLVPVAVDCCDMGIWLYSEKDAKGMKLADKILRLKSSKSPRKQARCKKMVMKLIDGFYA